MESNIRETGLRDQPAANGRPEPQYFNVTPSKFILMALCTFGIYQMYWNYRNWKYIRERDQSNIWPFWRCVFYPIWFYSLLTDINRHTSGDALDSAAYRVTLTVLLFILSAAWRQEDPYWLLAYLNFVPMLPPLQVIRALNASAGPEQHRTISHRPVNFIAYLLGGPLALYLASSAIGFVPSTMVVPGSQLWDRDVEMLREYGLLGHDEEILYFYSSGLFSVIEDGQFISDQYVTSYWQDPEDGEIYIVYAAYADIEEISVYWGETWVEDTIVNITPTMEEPFELWLSQEVRGDHKFIAELDRLWRESGGRGLALE